MSGSTEADVVVVGLGAAGANAAIAAHDAGSRVVVIEKMEAGGGNSAVSAGTMVIPCTVDQGVEYYTALCGGTVGDEGVRGLAQAMVGIPDQLSELGVAFTTAVHRPASFPTLVKGNLLQLQVNPTGANGFRALEQLVAQRQIPVVTDTQATALVQRPGSREVVGVRARHDGKEIEVSARQAVVLTCGGYANNPAMLADFNVPAATGYVYSWGSPGNTGDGVRMASQSGAALWHMAGLEWGKLCARRPSAQHGTAIAYGIGRPNRPGSYIFVNQSGHRFMAEDTKMSHRKASLEILQFDHATGRHANLPAFLVFDHKFLLRGPIAPTHDLIVQKKGGPVGHSIVNHVHEWSHDNNVEIDAGWIVRADSIDDLAHTIGVAPHGLDDAVSCYNLACRNGCDPQFGRRPRSLIPLDTPPFYAVELGISLVNTQGGPKRNGHCQVLDHDDNPIPRLYAAGELGSFFGFLYQGGSNYPEAWAFGRIAGRSAAAERRWST